MADPRDFWHILPQYVKKDVVHYLDFTTKLNLSYCSKSDLSLVRSTPLSFGKIIFFAKELARPYTFRMEDEDRPAQFQFHVLNSRGDIDCEFDSTEEIVDRLIYMLQSPNTCQVFYFYGSSRSDPEQDEMNHLIRELDRLSIRPRIRTVIWVHRAGEVFHDFLTRLDSDYLEGTMVHSAEETIEQVARITDTEQWKKMKVVDIPGALDPTWRLEHVFDKPKFNINLEETSADIALHIVKTFQEKNHPEGSFFIVGFYNKPNAKEIFEKPGRRRKASHENSFYRKRLPLADGALELRVQLKVRSEPVSCTKVHEMSGLVTRQDAQIKFVDVSEIIDSCLYDY